MTHLLLKRAALSRPSGKWDDDDFDVLADGVVVGRIFKADAAPAGMPWMWTMLIDYRWPTHGYAASRETAMAAFARVGGGSKACHRKNTALPAVMPHVFPNGSFPFGPRRKA